MKPAGGRAKRLVTRPWPSTESRKNTRAPANVTTDSFTPDLAHSRLFGLGLIAVTMLVYLPALRGGFIWDDETHITDNPTLRTLHGLWDIWFVPGATCQYYPLSFTGFWIGFQLWGLNTLGYHLVNVLLHGTAAVLLWQVLEKLKVRGAWLAGAIFALHPVCVMSVAWMTELKNTLSGTLALGATWAFLRAAKLGVYADNKAEDKLDWKFYVLSLVLFQLAMFAKTAVSFLPVTLVLLSWWCGRRLNWRAVWPVLPMLGIAVAMGLLTVYVERTSGNAKGAQFQIPFVDRVLISGRSFWFYLGKLVYPHQLTFIYERWTVDAKSWWQYIYPIATAGALGGLWLVRKRVGKGLLVALLHFYVSTSLLILIVVLYMTRYSYVSDHWQYFGCMSVMAVAGAAIAGGLGRLGRVRAILEPAVCGGLLLTLGVLTWQQCGMYRDVKTLWNVTLDRNPNCPMAHNDLGSVLMHEGKIDDAMAHFLTVLKTLPEDPVANFNLGNALAQQNRVDEAIAHLQKALASQPDDEVAHNNLGNLLVQRGRLDEALSHLERAVQLKPDFANAQYNLGNVLLKMGRVDEAMVHYQKDLAINPGDAMAHHNLGAILLQRNRLDEGIAHFQATVAAMPDNALAHASLGNALLQKGREEEAIAQFQRALQLASEQGNSAQMEAFNKQLLAFQAGRLFRDAGQTNTPSKP